MTSKSLDSAKLTALYSLDFYKNKKNWILSDQKRDKSNKKNKLNMTFDVEQGKNLNDEFIPTFTDSEKASKTDSSLRASNLSQQWLGNIDIWPADTQNTLQPLLMRQRDNDDMISGRKGQSDAKSVFTLQDLKADTMPAAYQSPCGIEYCGFDHGDNLEFRSHRADSGHESELPTDVLAYYEQCFEKLSVSMDSYSAFCRGADLNPHCSEMDLILNDSMKDPDTNKIARMSSVELNNSIQRHAKALASLLRENNERQKLRQSGANVSNEDTDVTRDQAEFVAGSFRNRDYCVYIEYGRPVRFPTCS
ncbi:uncharacterized protein LOC123718606 isoform X2 [Pieris brassicae]|uniref:uncharacterized protein LOC123718606 isoform X2 n=1 Tax=Pieris brassicae TaxID=7116 RepID=UPI001E65EFC1|nr:uncharacterized protein LOC123718606 isoform X2 [Pieris brassicae]